MRLGAHRAGAALEDERPLVRAEQPAVRVVVTDERAADQYLDVRRVRGSLGEPELAADHRPRDLLKGADQAGLVLDGTVLRVAGCPGSGHRVEGALELRVRLRIVADHEGLDAL